MLIVMLQEKPDIHAYPLSGKITNIWIGSQEDLKIVLPRLKLLFRFVRVSSVLHYVINLVE